MIPENNGFCKFASQKGFFRKLAQDFVDAEVDLAEEEINVEEVDVLRDCGYVHGMRKKA